jgi:hypothetical protein
MTSVETHHKSLEEAIANLETMSPGALLAERGCLVARIEPQLLRRLRLDIEPWYDVAAEAELWFSALVQTRSATGIVLWPEAKQLLRDRLTNRPRTERDTTLDAIWLCVEKVQGPGPVALLAEARLIWLVLKGLDVPAHAIEAEAELRRLATTLRNDTRGLGLSLWGERALLQLPDELFERFPEETEALVIGTVRRTGSSQPLKRLRRQLPLDEHYWMGGAISESTLRLRLVENGVEIQLGDAGGSSNIDYWHEIRTPRLQPLVVTLRSMDGQSATRDLQPGPLPIFIEMSAPTVVTVQVSGGATFRLVAEVGNSIGPDVFARLAAERPRLMATKSAIERTRQLLYRSDTARRWYAEVEKQATLLLDLPPLKSDWVHDPRETRTAPLPLVRPPKSSDGPATSLDIARLFCLRIQTLGLMWLLTRDLRYRNRAKAELLAVCAFPDWAGDKFLVLAETAFGAAIGYDWLYDCLSDEERKQVAYAIVEKAVQSGLDEFAAPRPPRWATAAINWYLVCNGALMIAALSVGEFDQRAARLFSLCRDSILTGFHEYSPDGGWVEGPGYWHYATQYAIYLLDSLATALDTDLGLDASPGLARTGLFLLHAAGPSGKLFNFADSEEDHSGGYWLFWLAKRYQHPVDAWIELRERKVHPMDLLWFDADGRGPSDIPPVRRFRAADVVMLRGSWTDPNTTYLGIKAGANDACEHGHYDLGSFVLDANGVRWAVDLGPDDYGLPDYFKPEMRSRYYRTGTIGHNTIVINGECQPHDARAVITRERYEEKISFVVMDLSAAYPSAISALRGFALIDREHVLIVDEIVPKTRLSSVDWQMHTGAELELGDALATLIYLAQGDGAERPRFYLRIIDPGRGTLSFRSATPSEPEGQNPNADVAKVVFQLEQVAEPMRLAVLLSPDSNAPKLPFALRRPLSDWVESSRA